MTPTQPPIIDELALRLIEAAQENRVVLIPSAGGLRIENEESAPHSLLWMLREYSDLIGQTLRGLAQRPKHW